MKVCKLHCSQRFATVVSIVSYCVLCLYTFSVKHVQTMTKKKKTHTQLKQKPKLACVFIMMCCFWVCTYKNLCINILKQSNHMKLLLLVWIWCGPYTRTEFQWTPLVKRRKKKTNPNTLVATFIKPAHFCNTVNIQPINSHYQRWTRRHSIYSIQSKICTWFEMRRASP